MFKIKYLIIFLSLSACATDNAMQHANTLAQMGGLAQAPVQAGRFTLNTYSRIRDQNKPIHIYIEGDGLAWLSKNQPSPDPTPRDALALQLASVDSAENVVYIARPCQFFMQNCDVRYWTHQRFAEEIVASMNQAMDVFVRQTKQQPLHLIGYSGGAAIAVLLAARRRDIASIRTVAGNLDHVAVNAYHGVQQMPASLNPIEFADKVSRIPQLHFIAEQDALIPKEVAFDFVKKQKNGCAQVLKINKTSHIAGWQTRWPALLEKIPSCNL